MNLVFNIPKRYRIPRIIKKIYPYMNEADYKNEVENEYFLNREINICNECFFRKMKKCRKSEDDRGRG
jgi:hypothetical protein